MHATTATKPAVQTYRGAMTRPERWATWTPREGDILVCTPAKCGTTWTQSIIAHLLANGTSLEKPLPVLSPWIDVDLGKAEDVARNLEEQIGRRVVKTHTPADGFPVWDGVHVVAVYRHPLDVFLSLRKHGANMATRPDHPMRRPFDICFEDFLRNDFDPDQIDDDTLSLMVEHHARTVTSQRIPGLVVLHYSDMIADHAGTVRKLSDALSINASDETIARTVEATEFASMKRQAANYVPEGGTGLWSDDAAFFAEGGTNKWRGRFSDAQIAHYSARMEALVPDADTRRWLERGNT